MQLGLFKEVEAENWKDQYNHNLKRIEKAWRLFSSDVEIQEKWIVDYKELLIKQERLMKLCNLKSGDKEVLEGFEL